MYLIIKLLFETIFWLAKYIFTLTLWLSSSEEECPNWLKLSRSYRFIAFFLMEVLKPIKENQANEE